MSQVAPTSIGRPLVKLKTALGHKSGQKKSASKKPLRIAKGEQQSKVKSKKIILEVTGILTSHPPRQLQIGVVTHQHSFAWLIYKREEILYKQPGHNTAADALSALLGTLTEVSKNRASRFKTEQLKSLRELIANNTNCFKVPLAS